jgi:hypothetical protein
MWHSALMTLSISDTRHNNALRLWWMSLCKVSRFIYCYAEYHDAECDHAECYGAYKFAAWPSELYMVVINSLSKQARVFVIDSYIHLSLIFVGKPKRSPYFNCSSVRGSTWLGSSLGSQANLQRSNFWPIWWTSRDEENWFNNTDTKCRETLIKGRLSAIDLLLLTNLDKLLLYWKYYLPISQYNLP